MQNVQKIEAGRNGIHRFEFGQEKSPKRSNFRNNSSVVEVHPFYHNTIRVKKNTGLQPFENMQRFDSPDEDNTLIEHNQKEEIKKYIRNSSSSKRRRKKSRSKSRSKSKSPKNFNKELSFVKTSTVIQPYEKPSKEFINRSK